MTRAPLRACLLLPSSFVAPAPSFPAHCVFYGGIDRCEMIYATGLNVMPGVEHDHDVYFTRALCNVGDGAALLTVWGLRPELLASKLKPVIQGLE